MSKKIRSTRTASRCSRKIFSCTMTSCTVGERHGKTFRKTVTRHVWAIYLKAAEEYRHGGKYKKLYERQKNDGECFADAKEKTQHAIHTMPRRETGQKLGQAEIYSHESEKDGNVESGEGAFCSIYRIFPSVFPISGKEQRKADCS